MANREYMSNKERQSAADNEIVDTPWGPRTSSELSSWVRLIADCWKYEAQDMRCMGGYNRQGDDDE